MLDATKQSAARLLPRLGTADRRRIEAHLQSIREIETRLKGTTPTCALPGKPASSFQLPGGEDLEGKNRAMVDLLAVSLACDLTRVFNFEFTGTQSGAHFWQVGVNSDHHLMTHGEQGNPQVDLPKTVLFAMKSFAYMADKFRNTPDGLGNLLDSLCIYGTSEASDGGGHTIHNIPIVVLGKAGGALRTNLHHRPPAGDNASEAMLTLLRAVGLPLTAYGANQGQTSKVLSALLV